MRSVTAEAAPFPWIPVFAKDVVLSSVLLAPVLEIVGGNAASTGAADNMVRKNIAQERIKNIREIKARLVTVGLLALFFLEGKVKAMTLVFLFVEVFILVWEEQQRSFFCV
jgi:hypothetical protein